MTKSRTFFYALSLALSLFSSASIANEKVLKFRLEGIQSRLVSNFVEIGSVSPKVDLVRQIDPRHVSKFSDLHNDKNNIAFVFFDGQKVTVEKYNYNASPDKPLYVYSVTKSFTGLMLLHAMCQIEAVSLDDKMGNRSQRLKSTPYREVTIRNALKMQSGLGYEFFKKDQIPMFTSFLKREKSPLDWINAISHFEKQGQNYRYNGHDTNALGILLEDLTGKTLVENFKDIFVNKAGLEASAYWQKAGGDSLIGAYGLMAQPRDLVKLGRRYIEILDENKCLEKHFLKMFDKDQSSGEYGFQVRAYPARQTKKIYASGNGGQYIVMDRELKSVALIYSINDKYSHKGKAINIYHKAISSK